MKQNLIIIFFLLICSVASARTIMYVDGTVGSSGDGSSWAQAFKTIQEGIDAAEATLSTPASENAEVWVKQGTYYIYENSNENTLSMAEGVSIYGGFNGTESLRRDRDYENNKTIIDGHQYADSPNQVKHVVTAFGKETAPDTYYAWSNGLLDGFTITGGNMSMMKATDPGSILSTANESSGGGILMFKCGPNISNCIITENSSIKGGGIYIVTATEFPTTGSEPQPEITNCTFSNNSAVARGGGAACDVGSEPKFINCKFLNNSCEQKGGGIYIDWVCPEVVFINCLFSGNTAARAGAIGADGSSSPILINCTVTGNHTEDMGAGVYTGSYNPDGTDANDPTLINCIVSGNTSDWGGATDLRIWHENFFYVSHSNLGTGFTSYGDGVLYSNPEFVNAGTGDYTLSSSSPCINAGVATDLLDVYDLIPDFDINGDPRDANPDMGCYEYAAASSIETSPDNLNKGVDIPVYPNPANNVINITGLAEYGAVTINLINVYGAIVLEEIADTDTQLDISSFTPGLYILKISNENYSKNVQIVKQ